MVHKIKLALFVGASVSALGVALPAAAATVPGTSSVVTAPDVANVLTISNIGDDFDFGVSNSGAGFVTSTVGSVATGGVLQALAATGVAPASGFVTGTAVNAGAVEILASAKATVGVAVALATVGNGVDLVGFGDADVAMTLDNSGELAVVALASASAASFAIAQAIVNTGIAVIATAGSVAAVDVNNNGLMFVGASADAVGFSAVANAVAGILAGDRAIGGISASAGITNSGVMQGDVLASATATVGNAFANATVNNGYTAIAQGGTAASAAIANTGSMSVTASAIADAGVIAAANAQILAGVAELVEGPNASATITNSTAASIDLSVVAEAVGNVAVASAQVGDSVVAGGGVQQLVGGATAASANFDNDGTLDVSAIADAGAIGTAIANATMINGILQLVETPNGSASAAVANSGLIDIGAVAAAVATAGVANGNATVSGGIVQFASATAGTATISLVNSGTIEIDATAGASGVSAFAFAANNAIGQQAIGSTVTLDNSGTIDLDAVANATGAVASATAILNGITQSATGATAVAEIVNNGTVDLHVAANAVGSVAVADAELNYGLQQNVNATAAGTASFDNSGDIVTVVGADAVAATGDATAWAFGFTVIDQAINAGAGAGTATADNSGSVSVVLAATATGGEDALARVGGVAVSQNLIAATAVAMLDNSGQVSISGLAVADAGTAGLSDGAFATAEAFGFVQNIAGSVSQSASIDNSGTLDIMASASANGDELAVASALVIGVSQNFFGTSVLVPASYDNSGTIDVHAGAVASAAGIATALAHVTGYNLNAVNASVGMAMTVDNSGDLNLSATAAAPDFASAVAAGMVIVAGSGAAGEGNLSGTLVNSGAINAVASAAGAGTTVGSSANASGIYLFSGSNAATLTNSGSINVDAIVNGDGAADATGIQAISNGAVGPFPDLFTINNSGDIIVRVSGDGGTTWARGMAIDVATAPNNSVINLLGGGTIYGNIDIASDDVVNVDDGETSFDGIVNPEFLPVGGVVSATLDSGLFGDGMVNITADGALVLGDPRLTGPANMYDGPSYMVIGAYNQVAGGTIAFELQPAAGGVQPVGSYSQIFVDTANIDGTLVANITPEGGVLADDYYWDNVIDANVLTGTFDTCSLAGAAANSPLLQLECIYDGANNVDLGITRVAFNAVPDLTINQTSVAECLECLYDVNLAGPLVAIVAELFLLDEEAYPDALDQLAGASIASYLQSFNMLGVRYNGLLDKATECPILAKAGSVLDCRVQGVRVWGQLDYGNARKDGDVEAPAFDASQWTMLLGVDSRVGEAAIAGASLGKVTNRANFSRYGAEAKGSGYQFGLYGVYDPGAFYVKGAASTSWFDGDSERNLAIGVIEGELKGDPDVRQWTLGLHAGARVSLGGDTLTPYLNLDYVSNKLKGFTESGVPGANLHVTGAKEQRFYTTNGVKYALPVGGGAVLEADAGWRHMFGDRRSSFNAAFAGYEECDFDIISASEKRDSALFGLSLGGNVAGINVRAGYQGMFNGDATSHSANFKLTVPLGGK